MAELSAKVIQQIEPEAGATIWLCYVAGQAVANNDTLTVSPVTTVKGAFLISSTGVVGAMTFGTNVITITNASNLAWTGLAWGTP